MEPTRSDWDSMGLNPSESYFVKKKYFKLKPLGFEPREAPALWSALTLQTLHFTAAQTALGAAELYF